MERNYAKAPLERAEVEQILAVVPLAEAINYRHAQAKGYKQKLPSRTDFVDAVLTDNNLLRRPIFLKGKRYVVGWDERAIRALV